MPRAIRNNYDKSSTGTDIEAVCFRDTDRSQSDFKDNFEVLQHNSYSKTSVCYYTDNGNVKFDDVGFTVKGDKAAKIAWLEKNGYSYEYKDWDETDLDAEIIALNEVTLIDYALDKLPTVDGLEFMPEKNLIVLQTTGYSQGDYAKVIYCPEDLEAACGNYPKQESIQKIVDHYFWDAPIYATVTINEKEYSYWDMPSYDEYEWDKEGFAAYVAKESGVAADEIKELLPEYPEYQ